MKNNPTVIDQIQISLFPNNFNIQNPSSLTAKLLEEKIVSEEKLIINSFLPPNAPDNIVRIEALYKKNKEIQFKIAPAKISIFITNPLSIKDFNIDINEIEKIIKTLYQCCKDYLNNDFTFKRVGYVTTIYKVFKDENEVTQLFKKKIDFDEEDLLKEIEIKFTFDAKFDNEKWKGLKFNKHVVLATGYVTKEPEKPTAIVQYDLNLHQHENPKWDINSTMEFIKESHQKSSDPEKIFNEFFNE